MTREELAKELASIACHMRTLQEIQSALWHIADNIGSLVEETEPMSYAIADFTAQCYLRVYKAEGGGNMTPAQVQTALTAMATSVGADTVIHDRTIETPAVANDFTQQTVDFYRMILKIVNRGRAGNLTSAQMQTALNSIVP